MRFDFVAIETAGGREVASSLTVGDPLPVRAPTHTDYCCDIVLTGFTERAIRGFGADPLQAAALSIEIARATLQACTRDWGIHFSDEGPSTFDWPSRG